MRLTARPILDIALQYRFDSQQTFTRAFKTVFPDASTTYRRSSEWAPLASPAIYGWAEFTVPEHQFLRYTLEDTPLLGVTQEAIPARWNRFRLPPRNARAILAYSSVILANYSACALWA